MERSGMDETPLFSAVMVSFKVALEEIMKKNTKTKTKQSRCHARFKVVSFRGQIKLETRPDCSRFRV